jgi:hypothetical protein
VAGKPKSLKLAAYLRELRFNLEPLPIRCLAYASELIDQQLLALDEQVGSSDGIGRWQRLPVPTG